MFNDLYEYDFKLNKMNKIDSLSNPPTVRCNHTAMIYKRSLIIFGGWDGTRTLNDMYELSLSKIQ
jgi:N-acetylneuraminic acid mutarotase